MYRNENGLKNSINFKEVARGIAGAALRTVMNQPCPSDQWTPSEQPDDYALFAIHMGLVTRHAESRDEQPGVWVPPRELAFEM